MKVSYVVWYNGCNAVETHSMAVIGLCGCSYIRVYIYVLYAICCFTILTCNHVICICMHDFSCSFSFPHILLGVLVCLSVKL